MPQCVRLLILYCSLYFACFAVVLCPVSANTTRLPTAKDATAKRSIQENTKAQEKESQILVAPFSQVRKSGGLDWLGWALADGVAVALHQSTSADSVVLGPAITRLAPHGFLVATRNTKISGSFASFAQQLRLRIHIQKAKSRHQVIVEGNPAQPNAVLAQILAKLSTFFPKLATTGPHIDLEAEATALAYQAKVLRLSGKQAPALAKLRQKIEVPHFRASLPYALEYAQAVIVSLASLPAEQALSAQHKQMIDQTAALLQQFLNKRSTSQHPKYDQIYALLAALAHKRGFNHDMMERFARRALSQNPLNPLANLMLSLSLGMSSGEGKVYAAAFSRAHPWFDRPKTTNQSAYFNGIYADIFQRYFKEQNTGDGRTSNEALNTAFDQKLQAARKNVRRQNIQQARQQLSELLAENPKSRDARLLYAQTLEQEGKIFETMQFLLESSRQIPSDDTIHFKLADLYADQQQFELARLRFTRISRSSPLHLRAQEKVVGLLIRQKEYDKASQHAEESLAFYPKSAILWYQRGIVSWITDGENSPRAREYFAQAYALDPHNERIQKWYTRSQTAPDTKAPSADTPTPAAQKAATPAD